MGFSFKKALKKVVKLGGKIAKPLLATTPVGAAVLRGQQVLKSLGGNLKAARLGKIEPLSVRAPIARVVGPMPAKTLKTLPTFGSPRRRISVKGSRMPQKRRTATGTSKRVPPKGGLDLRAMAAQWRAAGKPGSWRDWIRSNQIRKQ